MSCFFLLSVFSAHADVYTWTGGAGDGAWSSALNWSGAAVPGPNDTIHFTAGQSAVISLSENVSVAGALIYNTTGTVTFNLNGYSLSFGNSGTGENYRFNLGSSSGGAAVQGGHAVINGTGSVSVKVFDSSQDADCSLILNNGVDFTVSDTIYADGTSVTTIFGDSSCSFTVPATYDTGNTNVIEFAGAMPVISKSGTYTVSVWGTPGAGATVTVVVSSTASFTQLRYALTVENADTSTSEIYTIDGSSRSVSGSWTKTVSPVSSSGLSVYTFNVVFPAVMDSGDGIKLTVQNSGGTDLGSLLFYAPSSSNLFQWNGSFGSDWTNASNWSPYGVPGPGSTVIIPSGTSASPELNAAVDGVKKITIETGAKLSLRGFDASGAAFVNNGTVELTGSESGIGVVSNGSSSTVVYDYAGIAYSASPVWGSDYVNLTVKNFSLLFLDRNITVSGAVLNEQSTIDIGRYSFSFGTYSGTGDTVSASKGTFTAAGAGGTVDTFTATTSAVINGGSGGIVINTAYYNNSDISANGNVSLAAGTLKSLSVSGGSVSLPSGSAVTGSLSIGSGGDFTAGALSAGSVSLAAGSSLTINGRLSVGGNWTNDGVFSHNSNAVEFTGSAVLAGSTSFYDLTMAGMGGKTLTVNGTVSVSHNLLLTGSNAASLLSVSGGGSIGINSPQMTGAYLSVSSSGPGITGFVYTAVNSAAVGGAAPSGWNLLSGALSYVWNGNSSPSWNQDANWNTGIVPPNDGSAAIVVPAGCLNWPMVMSALDAASLTVDTGAQLDLRNYGAKFNSGGCTNSGTVRLTGTQSISGTVTNAAGSTVEYYDNSAAAVSPFGTSFGILKTSAGKELDFSGKSITASVLEAEGSVTVKADTLSLTGGGSAAGSVLLTCNRIELGGSFSAGSAGPISFGGAVVIGNSVSISAASGNIDFTSSVNSGIADTHTLTIDAGSGGIVTFGGTVGNSDAFAQLSVTASSLAVNGGSVSALIQLYDTDITVAAAAPSVFTGSAEIGAGKVFTGNSGSVTFGGAVTNNGTITSGSGGLIFTDSVSGGILEGFSLSTVTVRNTASARFAPAAFNHNGCTFSMEGSGPVTVDGAYTFSAFSCTEPGKTIAFKAGSLQTVNGSFTITGTAGSPVSLQSTASPAIWFIDAAAANTAVSFAAISDSESYDVLVSKVSDSTGSNTINWLTCVYTWEGSFSSDWNTLANWKTGVSSSRVPAQIPLSDSSVCEIIIANNASGYPLVLTASIPAGGAGGLITLKSLTVNAGASLETGGRNITAQTADNNGSVTLKGTEVCTFNSLSNSASSTVIYRNGGAAAAPVWIQSGHSAVAYGNLTVDGSYPGGSGASDTVLQMGGTSVTVNGTLSNYGVIEINGTGIVSKTDSVRGKVIYSTVSHTIPAGNGYYDLAVTSETQEVRTALTVAGDLSVTGGVLSMYAVINVGKDVVNTASIALSSGTRLNAGGNITAAAALFDVLGSGRYYISSSGSFTAGNIGIAANSSLELSAGTSLTLAAGSTAGTGSGALGLVAPVLNINTPVWVSTLILAPSNTAASVYQINETVTADFLLLSAAGAGTPSFTLNNSANRIGTVAATQCGDISITAASSLVCGSVSDPFALLVTGISAKGAVSLSCDAGDITVSQRISSSGGSITLRAADFINLNYSGTVINTSGGVNGFDIIFSSPIKLNADASVNSSGTVSSGNIVFSGSIENAVSSWKLTVSAGSGTVTLSDSVGTGAVLLGELNINASRVYVNGAVVSAVNQTYTADVICGAPVQQEFSGNVIIVNQSFTGGTQPLVLDAGVKNLGSMTAGSGGIRFENIYDGESGTLANTAAGGIVFNNAISPLAIKIGTYTANGGTVTFSGSSAYALTPGSSVYGNVSFLNTAGVVLSGGSEFKSNGTVTVGAPGTAAILDFGTNNAGFVQSWVSPVPDFKIENGTVSVGTGTFVCGNLSVAAGSSFIQTGANANTLAALQSVQVMSNDGILIWDSSSAGGYLSLAGSFSGTKASDIALNNKNVSVTSSIQISGVFYDLTIPSGITVTNASGIRVRRNFTINGFYTHNSQILTLGGAGSAAGDIRNNNSVLSSLGSLMIEQGSTGKLFVTDIKAGDITVSGGSGSIVFSGKIDAGSFINTGGSFNLSFNNGAGGQSSSVSGLVTVSTSGIVSFGTAAADSFTASGALTVSAAVNEMRAAGSVGAASLRVQRAFRLTGPVSIDTGSGEAKFDSPIDGAFALNITAGSAVLAGRTGSTEALSSVAVTGTGTVELNGSSVTTAGGQTYSGAVAFGADTELKTTAGGAIRFSGAAGSVNGAFNLVLNSGAGDVSFAAAAGSVSPFASVQITAGKVDIQAPFTVNGNITVSNSGLFKTADGADITAGGGVSLTGTAPGAMFQLAGGVVSSSGPVRIGGTAAVPSDIYLYTSGSGTAAMRFSAGGGTSLLFAGNVFAACSGKTAVFDSDVSVTHNFVSYGIPVSFGPGSSGLDCGQDIILLGSNYSVNDAVSGVAGLFAYANPARTAAAGYAAPSLSRTALFPGRLPDGTVSALLAEPAAASVPYTADTIFTAASLGGKNIRAGKNFYANGVSLESPSGWNLRIPDNGKRSSAFAEAYNTVFSNCTVTGISGSTHAAVAAAENCTDNGSNTGVAFSRPYLLADSGIIVTDRSGTANRSGTYTVYDDVIRVEFRDDAGNTVLIENSENEINAALSHIKFNGGSFAGQSGGQKTFTGAFTDAACTVTTDGKGDLAVFYLQITDAAYRWNTDAAGTSAGDTDSTDRGRSGSPAVHRTSVPNLDIPKALASVYATLLDDNKNRIAHYHDNTGTAVAGMTDIQAAPLSQGMIFGAVTDRCAPVLISVRTGQELHMLETASAPGTPRQKPYDAHNFIEFRYSEPVDIGDLAASGGALNVQVQQTFNSAAEHGGVITGSGTLPGGSGLTVTGFASIPSGSLVTGSRDAAAASASTVHSVYRAFALTGSDAKAGVDFVQPHRVRIGIVSFTDGTVIRDGTVFHKWIGFIDKSAQPAGTVTRIANDYIVDLAVSPNGRLNNTLSHTGSASHTLPNISVDSTVSELYGTWDVSPPVFAKFAGYTAGGMDPDADSSSECEIIGASYRPDGSGGTTVTQIEFHVFDNTDNGVYQWVSKRGWMKGSVDVQVARDISGGSRAFDSQTGVTNLNKTSGGIRASSLEGAVSAFSFSCNTPGLDSSLKTFAGTISQAYYTNYLFDAAEHPTVSPPSDGLYFAIPLKSADTAIFPLRASFDIDYNETSSYITDLAGNRMKSAAVSSIDRTPPSFSLTVAPVKTDKLYIVFSKRLRCTASDLAVIPGQLELTDAAGTVAAINIDSTVPAELVKQTANGTGLVVTLTDSVTLSDVMSLRVRVKQPAATSIDPLTGLPDYIPEIYDTKGNAMIALSAHTLSDFAVNVVDVLYAFDGKGNAEADSALLGTGLYGTVYDENNWAVRDFSGSGANTGRMFAGTDITVATRVTDGTQTAGHDNAPAGIVFKLIAAVTYPPDTVSDTYNKHMNSHLRVWLPTELSSLASQPNTYERYFGEYAPDADALGLLRNFVIPNASDALGWTAGQEVQFLFGLYDAVSGLPVTIDDDADTNTDEIPLYALCLAGDRRGLQPSPSGETMAAFDLWSFKLTDKVKQRGGVTILNNVINASVREETVIEIDMPSSGNLTVQVLTLDGNVVKTLQKGRASSGLHYYRWNGTNVSGSPVARGMYFVRVTGSGFDETRKVMVVKE